MTQTTQAAQSQRQYILGAPVDCVSLPDALNHIRRWLDAPPGVRTLHHVVTVNPEFVMAARRDPTFARVLHDSALGTADGVGIVFAARLLGQPVGPRVTGVDLTEGIAALDHPESRIFLLGAAEGVAAEAAERLRARFATVRIAGTFAGRSDDAGFAEIEGQIASSGATVLLVAFGHPKQDLWIAHHREALATHGILVASGIGGSFDYLSGRVPRAPGPIRRLGLEWLYRLVRQPWRWRRQLALPHFVLLVLVERLRRFRSRPNAAPPPTKPNG